MATRFIKAKVDKYIQLYSKYAKHSGTFYSQIKSVTITTPGTVFYFSVPTITFTPPPTGGILATGTVIIVNGVPNTFIVTNPGLGYIAPPIITISGGGGGGGTAATFTAFVNKDNKREFEWDLENAIEINENALIQVVDRAYTNTSTSSVYTMRLLDISTQSVINTTDNSGNSNQVSFNQGKVIDIGYGIKTTPNDIKLEIQPQTINKIVILVDEGISNNKGISGNIEFFISLKIVEKEPSVIEYGALNNINTSQL